MPTYENAHFGLRLDIPDHWLLVSWRHSVLCRPGQSAYQTRDDELPASGPRTSMFLFTASLKSAESEVAVDAEIELSVFRVQAGTDFRAGLIKNIELRCRRDRGSSTSITGQGTWPVGGVDFGFADEEYRNLGRVSRYRYYFRPIDDVYWLYGKIAGHTKPAYEEAIGIVGAMKCQPGGAKPPPLPDGENKAPSGSDSRRRRGQ